MSGWKGLKEISVPIPDRWSGHNSFTRLDWIRQNVVHKYLILTTFLISDYCDLGYSDILFGFWRMFIILYIWIYKKVFCVRKSEQEKEIGPLIYDIYTLHEKLK